MVGQTPTNPGTNTDMQVQEVDRLVAMGVTVKRACKDVGIPRPTYYARKSKEKNPGALNSDRGNASHTDADPKDTASETAA